MPWSFSLFSPFVSLACVLATACRVLDALSVSFQVFAVLGVGLALLGAPALGLSTAVHTAGAAVAFPTLVGLVAACRKRGLFTIGLVLLAAFWSFLAHSKMPVAEHFEPWLCFGMIGSDTASR